MFFKKIDIYGSKVGFSINGRSSLNSFSGGIFTLLTIFIYILFFYLFSKDFFLRMNPFISSEKVFLTDSVLNNYTFINETMLFAIPNPVLYKDKNLYNLTLEYIEEFEGKFKKTKLNFISCEKTKFSRLFDKYNKAEDFYCIDFSNILNQNITNIHFSDYVKQYFIQFTIYYNYGYLASLNETYKQMLLDSEELFIFYLPKLSFSPNNYHQPIDIHMDYNCFLINQKIKFINDLKFVETKLEQDENFFYKKQLQSHSVIHFENQIQEIGLRKEAELLARFDMVLDGLYYNKFTREYKKIPDLLAQVMGIGKPLMIVFTYLIEYLTKFNLENLLIKHFLCYFTKDQNNNDSKIWEYKNFKDFKNLFKNLTNNKQNLESFHINKQSVADNNDNMIENGIKSNFKNNYQIEQISEISHVNELSTRKFFGGAEDKIIQSNNNIIKKLNFELDKNNQENINPYSNIVPYKPSDNITNIKNETFKNNKESIINSLHSTSKRENKFPYIGFIDYYFNFLIPKNNNNYKYKFNHLKILKYFSKEILNKLDLFYYLKLVRTTEILKNTFLRKKANKENLEFLIKSLYFVRDIDIDFVIKIIDEGSN